MDQISIPLRDRSKVLNHIAFVFIVNMPTT